MKWFQAYSSIVRLLNLQTLKRVLAVARSYVEYVEKFVDMSNEEKHNRVAEVISSFIKAQYGWTISPAVVAFIIKAVVELCTSHSKEA